MGDGPISWIIIGTNSLFSFPLGLFKFLLKSCLKIQFSDPYFCPTRLLFCCFKGTWTWLWKKRTLWIHEKCAKAVIFQIGIWISLDLFGVCWHFRNFRGVCHNDVMLLESKVRKSSSLWMLWRRFQGGKPWVVQVLGGSCCVAASPAQIWKEIRRFRSAKQSVFQKLFLWVKTFISR